MFDKVKRLLVDELQVDESRIKPETELAGDLELNSLELAEFVLTCEEKFGIIIKDDDLKTLVTVGDIVEHIEELTGKN
jgi:acyl carrier protein